MPSHRVPGAGFFSRRPRRPSVVGGKRAAAILVLALVVSAPFWIAAAKSLGHRGYLGTATARPVTAVCIGLIALAGVLSLIGDSRVRRWAALAVGGAAALFAASAAVASGTAWQIASAGLILFAAYGAGRAVLACFKVEADFSFLERGGLAAGLGLGLLSHFTLLLGLLHLLYPAVAFGTLAAVLVISHRFIWNDIQKVRTYARVNLKFEAADSLFFLVVVFVFLSVVTAEAMAPDVHFDDLHYHLYVPIHYVASHGVVLLPDVIQSYFYQGVEMLYTLAFLVGGETTAIFVNSCFGVLTALALAGFAGRLFSREVAWLSTCFWITTPLVVLLMTTAHVDVATAFFSFVATIVAFGWLRRSGWRLALLAGIFAGFAVAVKLNAAVYCLALGLTVLAAAWTERRLREVMRSAIPFAAGALVVGGIWPLLRFLQTGNPVYPFLNAIFRAPGLPFTNDWMNFGSFGMGKGLWALLELPWNTTFHADRFNEAVHPYVLGPCLLMAIAGCILNLRGLRNELRWAISVTALFAVAWFVGVQYLRYFVPALPLVAMIAGATAHGALTALRSERRRAALIVIATLFVVPSLVIWLASYYAIPERVPLRVIFGLESREAYRARILPIYAAFETVDGACHSSSGGVLSILNAYGYLCPQMVSSTSPRAAFVWKNGTDSWYRQELGKLDVDHIIIDDSTGEAAAMPFVASGFLARNGQLVYQGLRSVAVRILAPGEHPTHSIVWTQVVSEDATYQPGILAGIDPTFEGNPSSGSAWKSVHMVRRDLDIGMDPKGYRPPAEGSGALHVSLPGPSGAQEEREASAEFPLAVAAIEPARTYEFSFDLLCSGLNVRPMVRVHFTGPDNRLLNMTAVAVDATCDSTWKRFSANLPAPQGATGVFPEFGFTFAREFDYARFVEFDRLGLVPVSR